MTEWVIQKSGVKYSREYELREAARFANMSYVEFKQLPSHERSSVVAHYRTHNMIQAALSEKQKRKQGR